MQGNKTDISGEEKKPLSNDEQLNTSSTDESISSVETNPKSEQLTTHNSPPLTEQTMEVHHHGHVHEKKKWKEYLFQFLMLFLAVFCGFLAEYQLEHKIEKDREKEYIYSMIEDLQNDTTKLYQLSKSLDSIRKSIDTILMYYDDLGNRLNSVLNQNINAIYGYPIFIYSDRTIQQLKSSGGMRLIKNKKATDGIMNYDAAVRNYEINDAYIERYWENLTYQRIGIIDRQSHENNLKKIGEIKNDKNYLLINDPGILSKFKNAIYELNLYHNSTKNDQIELKEKASRLINILRKEYHLK